MNITEIYLWASDNDSLADVALEELQAEIAQVQESVAFTCQTLACLQAADRKDDLDEEHMQWLYGNTTRTYIIFGEVLLPNYQMMVKQWESILARHRRRLTQLQTEVALRVQLPVVQDSYAGADDAGRNHA
jgi:hypothetical protein